MRTTGPKFVILLVLCALGCALPESRSPISLHSDAPSSQGRADAARRPTSLTGWLADRVATDATAADDASQSTTTDRDFADRRQEQRPDETVPGARLTGRVEAPVGARNPRSGHDLFSNRSAMVRPLTAPDPTLITQASAFAEPTRKLESPVEADPPDLLRPPAPGSDPTLNGPRDLFVPLGPAPDQGVIEVDATGERVTLVVPSTPLPVVLGMIAQQHGLNLVAGDEVTGDISVNLHDVSLDDALDAILTVNGYTWNRQRGILLISSISDGSNLSSIAQGLVLRVIPLNYVSAEDIDVVVKGLLSDVGTSVVTFTDGLSTRRTREEIVVEDLPEYVARISDYIRQVDVQPRQVLIEAHILEVELEDETRHGVNWDALLQLSNTQVTLETTGFADPMASPAFFLGIDGTDLDALLEMLKATTDAKTLASPKVLALNAQNARIQIGEQLGYFVTTVTQTSTLQDVNFLNVGVVLDVTPIITDDGHIMMEVLPKVSGGQINPITGLPEEDTTEVETTVILRDGQGIIIGGLIQEEDVDTQSKIPIVGDWWKVGRLFQRRADTRSRSEVIIALIPRIIHDPACVDPREHLQYQRATTPLLEGPLEHVDRRLWEPELPDAMDNPRQLDMHRLRDWPRNMHDPLPLPVRYFFPTEPERFRPPLTPPPVVSGAPILPGQIVTPYPSDQEQGLPFSPGVNPDGYRGAPSD